VNPSELCEGLAELTERQAAALVKELEALSTTTPNTVKEIAKDSIGEVLDAIKRQLKEEFLSRSATHSALSSAKLGGSVRTEADQPFLTVQFHCATV